MTHQLPVPVPLPAVSVDHPTPERAPGATIRSFFDRIDEIRRLPSAVRRPMLDAMGAGASRIVDLEYDALLAELAGYLEAQQCAAAHERATRDIHGKMEVARTKLAVIQSLHEEAAALQAAGLPAAIVQEVVTATVADLLALTV